MTNETIFQESTEFGQTYGRRGYDLLSEDKPHLVDVDKQAKRAEAAVRIGMVVTGRLDIDPKVATDALLENLHNVDKKE
jgi:hypothetical protein